MTERERKQTRSGEADEVVEDTVAVEEGEALTVLLGRRPPQAAPRYVQFDPYRMTYRRGRLLFGNRGPLQRIKRMILAKQFRHIEHEVTG